jgi:nucleoside-diphosphate-sugar epimerase
VRVLVTGGSGYLGAHTVSALLHAGHEVRVFARSADRVRVALEPLGAEVGDIAPGDVTDPASVEAALLNCDAVVHAASVYSLDPRNARTIGRTNTRGTRVVLEAARDARIDPIVDVSSYVAYLPSAATITHDSPLGKTRAPYARSKAASEAIAREIQASGASVTIVSPTSVWGPNDPSCGESCRLLSVLLRNRAPFLIPGGLPITDVRYVAAALAAAVEPGKGPRRFLIGGHDTTWRDLIGTLRRLTGRRLPEMPTPKVAALGAARVLDVVQRIVPGRAPFGREAIEIGTQDIRTDDSFARTELGVEPIPLEETLTDMIRWMVRSHRIPSTAAGTLA